MSKKKKLAKATEVTNIFNITFESMGGRHAVPDDPFDEDFMDHGFTDHDFPDDCDCDGDCENCGYYDGDEEDSDDFDEDDVPAIVRFTRMRNAGLFMYKSFEPDPGEFDYLDENPSNDNLAQEVSRISNIGNITAFYVLEVDNLVSTLEDCYDDFYDHHSRYDYISALTGIHLHAVIEVLTVVGVIRKKIQDTIAEAGGSADAVADEPF